MYKSRPSRIFYDGKDYFVYQLEGHKLQKKYIKVPKNIPKNKVQQWILNKFSGKLSTKDKINPDERVYYEPPKSTRTSHTSNMEPPTRQAKASEKDNNTADYKKKELVSEAKKYLANPQMYGPQSFSRELIDEAQKELDKELREQHITNLIKKNEETKREQDARNEYITKTENLLENEFKIPNKTVKYDKLPYSRDVFYFYKLLRFVKDFKPTFSYFKSKVASVDDLEDILWRPSKRMGGPRVADFTTYGEAASRIVQAINSGKINTNLLKKLVEEDGLGKNIQIGGGKLPPLYNDEIDDLFDNYPYYSGCIASDEINKLPNKIPQGFVMNLDKSDKEGSHWIACYITPDSVEYFDPLGNPPSKEFIHDIRQKLLKMKIPIMLKLKVNAVKVQNPNSYHCGYFAVKFLHDRFDGIPYDMTTRYKTAANEKINDARESEKEIQDEFKNYKIQEGKGGFGYI